MFGLYELQMPSVIQTACTHHSNAQKAGAFVGVAVMGVLSALICGPCITAPLVAALVVIGETGSALRGGMALFALGLGMGMPLLDRRHFRRQVRAQSGPLDERGEARVRRDAAGRGHLVHVPRAAGPGDLGPVGGTGHRLRRLSVACGCSRRLAQTLESLGVLLVIYGIIMLVGAATGGGDPLRPLARFQTGAVTGMRCLCQLRACNSTASRRWRIWIRRSPKPASPPNR